MMRIGVAGELSEQTVFREWSECRSRSSSSRVDGGCRSRQSRSEKGVAQQQQRRTASGNERAEAARLTHDATRLLVELLAVREHEFHVA